MAETVVVRILLEFGKGVFGKRRQVKPEVVVPVTEIVQELLGKQLRVGLETITVAGETIVGL